MYIYLSGDCSFDECFYKMFECAETKVFTHHKVERANNEEMELAKKHLAAVEAATRDGKSTTPTRSRSTVKGLGIRKSEFAGTEQLKYDQKNTLSSSSDSGSDDASYVDSVIETQAKVPEVAKPKGTKRCYSKLSELPMELTDNEVYEGRFISNFRSKYGYEIVKMVEANETIDSAAMVGMTVYGKFKYDGMGFYWIRGEIKKCFPANGTAVFHNGKRVTHDVKFANETFVTTLKLESSGYLSSHRSDTTDPQPWFLVKEAFDAEDVDSPDNSRESDQISKTLNEDISNSSNEEMSDSSEGTLTDDEKSTNIFPTSKSWKSAKGKQWKFSTRPDGPADKSHSEKWSMGEGRDKIKSRDGIERPLFDYFQIAFPWTYVNTIVTLTNVVLNAVGERETSVGEFIKFIGIMLAMTQVEFNSRTDCWKTLTDPLSCRIPLNFGERFGMSKNRWETLRRYLTVSKYDKSKPSNVNEANLFRWKYVSDFFDAFNEWYGKKFKPSANLCIDESFSRWYGLGGFWSYIGLPHYVSFDRKPEAGCELYTMCDGISGVLCAVEIVTGDVKKKWKDIYNSGTATILRLCERFDGRLNGKYRAVYGDSWFASLECAMALRKELGMYFTGCVKTNHAEFPMNVLNKVPLEDIGDATHMTYTDESKNTYLATVWTDRTRRTFVSSHGTTNPGPLHSRRRWRNNDDPKRDGYGMELKEISIPQPEIIYEYYQYNARIDEHNRYRQDTLNLEKKIEVRTWPFRLICTLIGIIVTNAYLLYKWSRTGTMRGVLSYKTFIDYLAREMIFNDLDGRELRRLRMRSKNGDETAEIGNHDFCLETTKIMIKHGSNGTRPARRRCHVCKGGIEGKLKTMFVCNAEKHLFVCFPKDEMSKKCYRKHVKEHHTTNITQE